MKPWAISLTLVLVGAGVAACGSTPQPAQSAPAAASNGVLPSTTASVGGRAAASSPVGTATAGSAASAVTGAPTVGKAGAGATAAPVTSATGGGGMGVPCAISDALTSSCGSCHGATPQNGAPMALVTYADFMAPAKSNPMRKVFELVAERVEDRARPMPPDPTKRLSDALIGQIKSWAASGAAAGAACTTPTTSAGAAGAPAAGSGSMPTVGGSAGAGAGVVEERAADIEDCYELRAHGQPSPTDKTMYTVPPGETYTSFIFKAPWTKPVQGLRFRHLADNAAVLHHWLLFSETDNLPDGSLEACELAGPTGFLCGAATTRSLITGWAPGRKDFALPSDVGLELPAPGALMAVEFHYYNTGSSTAQDRSGVEVCVSSKFRKNTASVSWLGTETIQIPAKTMGTAAGTCNPLRTGMNATDPINVLYSWPHMHKLGTHLKSVVNRKGGMQEVLYDGDFSFEFQVLHDSPMKLNPGDTVTTTCTFNNTTNAMVGFGQSTTAEMCFNFAYAWPAHALDNPGGAIGSSPNSCFH